MQPKPEDEKMLGQARERRPKRQKYPINRLKTTYDHPKPPSVQSNAGCGPRHLYLETSANNSFRGSRGRSEVVKLIRLQIRVSENWRQVTATVHGDACRVMVS